MNEENISINNEKIINDDNNIEKELNNEEKKNMIVNASFSRVLFDKSMNDKVSIISNLINQKNDIKSFFSTNTNNLNNELSKSPKKKKDDDLMNEFKKLKMILNAKENEFNNLKEQYMKKKKKLYQKINQLKV